MQLDADLPTALVPLAWLIGRWEGAGVVGYPTIESVNFGQEVECRHDGRNFLEWHSHTWLLDQATGEKVRPLSTELYVIAPEYVAMGVTAAVELVDPEQRDAVLEMVSEVIRLHLWPLGPGGPDGLGWPLGRAVDDRFRQ